MQRVVKGGNRPGKRLFGAVTISSTGLLCAAALAGVTALSFGAINSALKSKKKTEIVSPAPTPTPTPTSAPTVTPTPTSTAGTPGLPATRLGINLTGLEYFANTRSFSNLMSGGLWTLVKADGGWVSMPGSYMDANKNIVGLAAGEQAARQFSPPTAAYRGVSVDIVCKWEGTGTVWINGPVVQNLVISRQSATFTFVPQSNYSGTFLLRNMPANDPIRNIDCREKDADPNALFDPTYLAEVKRYSTIRFLKWMRSAESNIAVTWATRTKPGDGVYNGSDSVPVEYMVALANQTRTNPWFTLSWNADPDYVRRFATYVRDNLDPSLVAYVENSNEVWNGIYPSNWQARDEARAAGFTGLDFDAVLTRYAEKTGQVMDIWASVYAGQMNRLVRVAATQNMPYAAEKILGYQDTAKKVDLMATAPYFYNDLKAGSLTTDAAMSSFFDTTMTSVMDLMLGEAKKVKDIAGKYGLRYVTYEGGQHITGSSDLAQLAKVQKDPRIGGLYTRYLTKWRNEIGDLNMLFADYGAVSGYGSWGQQDYPGQPLSQAPKAQAVELFRQSYVR